MTRTKNSTDLVRDPSSSERRSRQPSVVGRLGIAHDLGRTDMLEQIHAAGHPDVTHGMIALFRQAGVDQRRPSEIAATARLSKQATNDMLRELERLGYVERHRDPTDGRARIIKLTESGRTLDAAVWAAGRAVEQAWRGQFERRRWDTFKSVLAELTGHGQSHEP